MKNIFGVILIFVLLGVGAFVWFPTTPVGSAVGSVVNAGSAAINFIGNAATSVYNFVDGIVQSFQAEEYESDMNIYYTYTSENCTNEQGAVYVDETTQIIITLYTDEDCTNREYLRIARHQYVFDSFLWTGVDNLLYFESSNDYETYRTGWAQVSDNEFFQDYNYSYIKTNLNTYRITWNEEQIKCLFDCLKNQDIEKNTYFDYEFEAYLRIYNLELKQNETWVSATNKQPWINFYNYYSVAPIGTVFEECD